MKISLIKIMLPTFFVLNVSSVSFSYQSCVYYHDVDDQIENKGIDPAKKIYDLISDNTGSRCIRYSLKFTGEYSYYLNDVLYEKNKKTITFNSLYIFSGVKKRIHYRFYGIDRKILRKWIKVSRSRGSSYSPDMELFILSEIGVRVKNLRDGKVFVSREQIPEY